MEEEQIQTGNNDTFLQIGHESRNSFNYMTNKDLKKYDITLKDVGLTIEKKSFKKVEKTRILHSVNVSFKVKKKKNEMKNFFLKQFF